MPEVRGIHLSLATHTRALSLCARMNRETEVLDFIDAIAPGETLYDLGACEGRFSLYAALKGVRVFAFEPEARNFETLRSNHAANGSPPTLSPVPWAVGDRSGTAVLSVGQPWAGGHHRTVGKRADLGFPVCERQVVTVVRLDDCGLPGPDYIKADVDGSELAFVRGARETLRRAKGMIFELYKGDSDYEKILDELAALGWRPGAEFEVEPGLFNVVFQK